MNVNLNGAASDALSSLGLPAVEAQRLSIEIGAAMEKASELLRRSCARLAAQLQKAAESLENKIPPYVDYVIKEWDSDKITEELIEKQWDWFATSWVGLTKLFNAAKAFEHALVGGKFEATYETAAKAAERSLRAGRSFVAVVST
eukprot:1010492-Pyramimonas_sp.AAC.1